MTVYAAGAVLWRIEKNQLKVALVHRGRYDDWSWAKGKVDPGETLPETAVREIREETGLKVKLGVPLGIQRYLLPNKNLKEVHYWAAKVSDKALEGSNFKPNEEVAEVVWLTAAAASKRLSYSHDQEQLDQLVALHKKGQLDTVPLIVLRHAKATARADWKGGEATRPLLPEGVQQAEALKKLLKAYYPKRVYTSPWARCKKTVTPYTANPKVSLYSTPALTETANSREPRKTVAALYEIVASGKSSMICTHRPVLPTVIETLETKASDTMKIKLHLAAALKPGSFTVIHLSQKHQIVDVENHSPIVRKKK